MKVAAKNFLPKAMVLCGDGINCERETAAAFEIAGFDVTVTHVNQLIRSPEILGSYKAMALPGGFSFGDELGSGHILAEKLRNAAAKDLADFVRQGKPILGICNGFQALVKLGLLPWSDGSRAGALAHNSSGQFINRWVDVEFPESVCIWTKGFDDPGNSPIQLPVRHGEGRFFAEDANSVLACLQDGKQIPIRYAEDFNGSLGQIAGLCDPTGVVFGLMPHPEAALADWLHPSRKAGSARGLEIFKNARRYVDEI